MRRATCRRRAPIDLAIVALVAAALVTLAPGPSAHAHECPAPGGERIEARAQPETGRFVFAGRGWGHGVGMSQYGAQGAARLGCSAEQILQGYYDGIAIEAVPAPGAGNIRVGIAPDRPGGAAVDRYRATNTGDTAIRWRVRDASGWWDDDVQMAPGRTWTLEQEGGGFVVHVGSRTEFRDERIVELRAVLHDGDRRLELDDGTPYERGAIWFVGEGSDRFSVQASLATIEEYLLGVREVPGSFPLAAQGAQAITARSYAYVKRANGRYGNCDCHIYASVFDQVYAGARAEPPSWVAAVGDSTARVLRRDGRTVTANYASSHGGHSESASFVWGAEVAHQQAVDDSRWDLASDNPYRTWTLELTPEQAGERLGVGTLRSIRTPDPKGAAGRIGDPARGYGGVVAEGTERTRTVSGNQARTLLGLRSTLFTVADPPDVAIDGEGTPLTVGWAPPAATSEPAWFADGRWGLRTPDGQVHRFSYGRAGDEPVVGDWNGDGQQTPGVIRDGTWHLKNRLAGGSADVSVRYGRVHQGDLPVVGDWNRDGRDGIGVVRDGVWHLKHRVGGGSADLSFRYGRADDEPVVGDFSGDGRDTAGVVRGRTWHLSDRLSAGGADWSFAYGLADDRPVTGDWSGDGADRVGIVRDTTWALRDALASGAADRVFSFGG